jgi:hypothetical protein
MQAYRITGNPDLLTDLHRYVELYLPSIQDERGSVRGDKENAAFLGYLARQIIGYIEETGVFDGAAMDLVNGLMRFNYTDIRFSFWTTAEDWTGSSYMGQGLVDPLVWYLWKDWNQAMADQLLLYATEGLGEGSNTALHNKAKLWTGAWHGRLMQAFLRQYP